eukprot:CAMPEP_0172444712 /NCGR_PEP_ID=MMETSP1065-20121228/4723_1 /TAXON_ID=265537 /ORGANISM="Amphiprora paludosa, Strain CCMP125" /LENGTH=483 /DNA_ID=CAMNT_0013195357 /DNA_START=131 /DNA_END=1582 /DNA_ORIENTATION=-
MCEVLECDYERGCTTLYKKIEEKNYAGVMEFLDTGYWPGTFFADPADPIDQVRTWVTRFDLKETRQVRWSQLPLHLAVVMKAPLKVIRALVDLYPQAARCTDDQRMLPLHLAMRHGCNDETVAVLLKEFPEAVNVRGGKGEGHLPLEYAVRGSNKVLGDILETFIERTQAKASKAAARDHSRELEYLQAKLQAKEYELSNVKDKLDNVDDEKARLEQKLDQKRKLLKATDDDTVDETVREAVIEETDSAKELEKRIDELTVQQLRLQKSETQVKQEERVLREELLNSMLDQSVKKYVDEASTDSDEEEEYGPNEEARDDMESGEEYSQKEGEAEDLNEREDEEEDEEGPRQFNADDAVSVRIGDNEQETELVSIAEHKTKSSASIKSVKIKQELKASTEPKQEAEADVSNLKSEIDRLRAELDEKDAAVLKMEEEKKKQIQELSSPRSGRSPKSSRTSPRSLFGRKRRTRLPSKNPSPTIITA